VTSVKKIVEFKNMPRGNCLWMEFIFSLKS